MFRQWPHGTRGVPAPPQGPPIATLASDPKSAHPRGSLGILQCWLGQELPGFRTPCFETGSLQREVFIENKQLPCNNALFWAGERSLCSSRHGQAKLVCLQGKAWREGWYILIGLGDRALPQWKVLLFAIQGPSREHLWERSSGSETKLLEFNCWKNNLMFFSERAKGC